MLAQGLKIIRHIVAAHLCGVRWTTGESASSCVDEDETEAILQEFESLLQIAAAQSPTWRNHKQKRSVSRNPVVQIDPVQGDDVIARLEMLYRFAVTDARRCCACAHGSRP